jgi:glycosyltransferase involved in cell wall biosynthesis
MRPFFTIIIPTHRRAHLLERSIDSLRAQTFRDLEIIVISDCADEETFRVAARKLNDSDVFIKRGGPPGPAESRNHGLEIASGDYIIFLDDDDTLAPSYLETLYCESGSNRRSVIYCNFDVVSENRDTIPATFIRDESHSLSSIPLSQLYVKNFIPNNVLAYPRMAIEKKRFDPHLMYEDWDFLLNISEDAELQYRDIYGVKIHKDESSKDIHRGEMNNNNMLIVEYLYIYRKWPGRTDEIKRQRQQLMMTAGMQWPLEWL